MYNTRTLNCHDTTYVHGLSWNVRTQPMKNSVHVYVLHLGIGIDVIAISQFKLMDMFHKTSNMHGRVLYSNMLYSTYKKTYEVPWSFSSCYVSSMLIMSKFCDLRNGWEIIYTVQKSHWPLFFLKY